MVWMANLFSDLQGLYAGVRNSLARKACAGDRVFIGTAWASCDKREAHDAECAPCSRNVLGKENPPAAEAGGVLRSALVGTW